MSDAARLSRMLWDARELIEMFFDVMERTGVQDRYSRRILQEIDAYRAERGWSPDGFGGEEDEIEYGKIYTEPDGTKKMYVTPAQVQAAQMVIKLKQEDGEEIDSATRAIAEAEIEDTVVNWSSIGRTLRREMKTQVNYDD